MAFKTFAAIHVGSGEASMRIYEISQKKGIQLLDFVRSGIELGSDTYRDGYISHEAVHELCTILKGFVLKMQEYGITEYAAYGSSALKEAENYHLIIDQILLKTGLHLTVIDNARQRYLILKSIAAGMNNFDQLLSEGTLILDMGSGSMQLTLYDSGRMVYTQHLKLGALRVLEMLSSVRSHVTQFNAVMDDYIGNDIDTISRLFLSNYSVGHMIIAGEEIMSVLRVLGSASEKAFLTRQQFEDLCGRILSSSPEQLSADYHIPYDQAALLEPAVLIYRKLASVTGAGKIWMTDAGLCDGMAVDYANTTLKIHKGHHFADDMAVYAREIARRYHSGGKHSSNVEQLALAIFDGIKKQSGLMKRERLLLQLSCILHDCGKYMSIGDSAYYSFQIVMANEFLGLSEAERSIVADAVYYNGKTDFPARSELLAPLGDGDYILMLKLAAILYVANILDRSHRQKIRDLSITLKEKEMIIRADTIYDITLEQEILDRRSEFFESIYGYEPVLRSKRR